MDNKPNILKKFPFITIRMNSPLWKGSTADDKLSVTVKVVLCIALLGMGIDLIVKSFGLFFQDLLDSSLNSGGVLAMLVILWLALFLIIAAFGWTTCLLDSIGVRLRLK